MSGKLFVVSAPSGAGKTTLVNALLEDIKSIQDIKRVVTYTTREPRAGEKFGIDYHFIDAEDFQDKIKQNYFIEWSAVYKTFYGSPIHIIDELKFGQSYIAIVDYKGAQSIKNIYPRAHTIWIMPPSIKELENRLVLRDANTPEDLIFRLQIAQNELTHESQVKFFDYHIINDDFLRAQEALKKIILNNI